MFIRVALTNVEKEWLRQQPPGTIVVPYLDPVTGNWSINTAEALLGGATPPSIQEPDDVTNLVATVVSATRIDLSWDYAGPDPEGFFIYQNGTLRQPVYNEAAVSFICDNLTPDTVYTFEVSTFNTAIRFEGTKIAANPLKTPAGTPVITAPKIVDPGPQAVTIGGSLSLQLTTYDGVAFPNSPTTPRTFLENPGILDNYGTLTTAGLWTWTPSTAGAYTQVIAVYDRSLQRAELTIPVTVTAAQLSVTPPGSLDLTATQGAAYDSGTFTVVGGVGPFTDDQPGLPAGIGVTWLTERTFKLTGIGTANQSRSYVVNMTISSADGQSYPLPSYTLVYTATTPTNSAPVWHGSPALPDTINATVDSAISTFDLDTYVSDADGDTLTAGFHQVLDNTGAVVTPSTIGLAVDGSKVVSWTPPDGAEDGSPYTIQFYADDGKDAPLTLLLNIVRQSVAGSAPQSGQGGVAAGGTGTKTFALRKADDSGAGVVGTDSPSWLGTLNTSTGIFPNSGNMTAGTWSFGIAVADSASPTPNRAFEAVTIVIAASAPADTFPAEVAASAYATDFERVFKGGAVVSGRAITDLTSLLAEASQTNNSAGIDLVDHPTIPGRKCMRLRSTSSGTTGGGSWFARVDGSTGTGANGVQRKTRLYFKMGFLPTKALLDYRQTDVDGMKLFYFGDGFANGQMVVGLSGKTGHLCFHGQVNGSDDINSVAQTSTATRVTVPQPNAWNNYSGLYRKTPLVDNGGAMTTKTQTYQRFGCLDGSSYNMQTDLNLTKTGDPNPYLSQRQHILEGVEQGWPPQCIVDSGAPRPIWDVWNEVELFCDYNLADLTKCTVQLWHAIRGQQPRLGWDYQRCVTFGNDTIGDMWKQVGAVLYWSSRGAVTGRPTQDLFVDEFVISDVPIPFKGLTVGPPGNLG